MPSNLDAPRRRLRLPGVALCAIAAVAALAFLASAREDSRSPSDALPGFAVLQGQSSAMPLRLRQRAIHNMGGPRGYGLDFAHSHRLGTSVGPGMWAVLGEDVLCLIEVGGAASACSLTAVVKRKGAVLEVGKAQPSAQGGHPLIFMMGLMPDGVAAVRVHLMNGSKRTVGVSENVFASRARSPMVVEAYRRQTGRP